VWGAHKAPTLAAESERAEGIGDREIKKYAKQFTRHYRQTGATAGPIPKEDGIGGRNIGDRPPSAELGTHTENVSRIPRAGGGLPSDIKPSEATHHLL